MTSQRTIMSDAAFMLAYIGLVGAMLCLTLTLAATYALGLELAIPHGQALAINLMGWMSLPFAAKAYRPLTGKAFSWRSNPVLGGLQ